MKARWSLGKGRERKDRNPVVHSLRRLEIEPPTILHRWSEKVQELSLDFLSSDHGPIRYCFDAMFERDYSLMIISEMAVVTVL